MKRIPYAIQPAIFLVLAWALSSCKSTAYINCPSEEHVVTDFGHYNDEKFPIGFVIELIRTSDPPRGAPIGQVDISPGALLTSELLPYKELKSESSLTIRVEGGSAKKKARIKAELESMAESFYSYMAVNSYRKSLDDYMKLLHDNTYIMEEIREKQQTIQGDTLLVGFVHAVTYADSLHIRSERADSLTGTIEIMKIANKKVECHFRCSNTLHATGPDAPMLWKMAVLYYHPDQKRLFSYGGNVDLTTFDFSNTLVSSQ